MPPSPRLADTDSARRHFLSWTYVVPRNPAKQRTVADWQITRITGKGARYLGQVEAPRC